MPFINHATKTIAIKIVYYGPGLSGKTTNLRYIYHKLDSAYRGELVCLETETDRTYFFDLLPIRAGMIGEFKVHFQLMSCPGQVFYEASRKSVLQRRRRHRLRGRLPDPAPRRQPGELRRPAPQLPPARHRPDEDPARLPVQQARPRLPHPGRDLQQPPQSPATRPGSKPQAVNGVGVFETLREISKLTVPVVRERLFGVKPRSELRRRRRLCPTRRPRTAEAAGPATDARRPARRPGSWPSPARRSRPSSSSLSKEYIGK
ncbi:MAG: hypothetical protein MZU95_06945 [Desulfomicrobium escambiense]|nr:hypothetical protein [Desulfomicrobium escambiense]